MGRSGKFAVVGLDDAENRIAESQRQLRQREKHESDEDVVPAEVAEGEMRQAQADVDLRQLVCQRRIQHQRRARAEGEQGEHRRNAAVVEQQQDQREPGAGQRPAEGHHLQSFEHEGEAEPEHDADADRARHERGDALNEAARREGEPSRPVARPAAYTACGVIETTCAACVAATAPIAFMGCTGTGVR